ncbi:MAG: hypothetical protein HYX32_04525 [Actinobacteria bacterium]|nr:hypothetical protein [Actinomycetota bacterium]
MHPLAQPAADAPADDATWRAEHEEDAARLLLARSDTLRQDGDADVDDIAHLVRTALGPDEAELIALLRSSPDQQQLEE